MAERFGIWVRSEEPIALAIDPYVYFDAIDISRKGGYGDGRQRSLITIDREKSREIYEWLKAIFEPPIAHT